MFDFDAFSLFLDRGDEIDRLGEVVDDLVYAAELGENYRDTHGALFSRIVSSPNDCLGGHVLEVGADILDQTVQEE